MLLHYCVKYLAFFLTSSAQYFVASLYQLSVFYTRSTASELSVGSNSLVGVLVPTLVIGRAVISCLILLVLC